MKKNSHKYMIYSLLFSNEQGVTMSSMLGLIQTTKMTIQHEIRNLRNKGVNIVFSDGRYAIK